MSHIGTLIPALSFSGLSVSVMALRMSHFVHIPAPVEIIHCEHVANLHLQTGIASHVGDTVDEIRMIDTAERSPIHIVLFVRRL